MLEEQAAEQPREDPNRPEEPGAAGNPALSIRSDAATRHDGVAIRVVGQRRAPGVQQSGQSDARAKVLGVGQS
jgi:hypothetical protein